MANFNDSLRRIPELIETNENLNSIMKDFLSTAPEMLSKHCEAVISDAELAKIRQTRCAMPDTSVLSKQIADEVRSELAKDIDSHVSDTVSSTIAKTKVKTETVHTILSPWEIAKMAEEKTKKFNSFLTVACVTILLCGVVGLFKYFNSKEYWGRQYWEIYSSKYITEAERNVIHDNASTYSIVPKEFYLNKSLAKSKIRRNKEILSLREAEAKKNKGKFSTKTPIE